MRVPAARSAVLLALPLLAACAAVSPPPPAPSAGPVAGDFVDATPLFETDGTVERDEATGAPVFVCRAPPVATVEPRWSSDGSVARHPATGARVFEERSEGRVARVLLVP